MLTMNFLLTNAHFSGLNLKFCISNRLSGYSFFTIRRLKLDKMRLTN